MPGKDRRSILSRTFGIGFALVALGACTTTPRLSDQLTDSDRAAMADARQQALEVNKSGEGLNWENPATGHRGVITPVQTYKSSADEDCRDFQETITVADQSYIDYGTACRLANGVWERRDSYDPVRYRRYSDRWRDPYYDHWGYPWGPYLYHSRYRDRYYYGPRYRYDYFQYGFGFGMHL
jgi:surface antigen